MPASIVISASVRGSIGARIFGAIAMPSKIAMMLNPLLVV
jgi:hypothetical protein